VPGAYGMQYQILDGPFILLTSRPRIFMRGSRAGNVSAVNARLLAFKVQGLKALLRYCQEAETDQNFIKILGVRTRRSSVVMTPQT
jgi:hypothetical protein